MTTSLDAMASGGIYDHLGGGFARYSVDAFWMVPHFEKMLYDQALLARTYLHAWQQVGEARWRQVLDETITYVLRDLRQPEGGSRRPRTPTRGRRALHVWRAEEIEEVLGPTCARAIEWYASRSRATSRVRTSCTVRCVVTSSGLEIEEARGASSRRVSIASGPASTTRC